MTLTQRLSLHNTGHSIETFQPNSAVKLLIHFAHYRPSILQIVCISLHGPLERLRRWRPHRTPTSLDHSHSAGDPRHSETTSKLHYAPSVGQDCVTG